MNFPSGLTEQEKQRATKTLAKLLPYLDISKIYFVGGLAARYYVDKAGLSYSEPRGFNDIDIVFDTFEAINTKITDDFLVHHYHVTKTGNYLVLVDPETSTKIDFFYGKNRPIHDSTSAEFSAPDKKYQIKLRSLEDQFVEYVRDCYRIVNITDFRNKQHYYTDAKILRKIVDLDKAQELFAQKDNKNFPSSPVWIDKKTKELPGSLLEAFDEAINFAENNPDRIITTGYSQSKGPKECPNCVMGDKDFPVADPTDIFDAMGWDY